MKNICFVLVVMAVMSSVACSRSETNAVPQLNPEIVAAMAKAQRGDLVRMTDDELCLMRAEPWKVLGSDRRKPETLEIRMDCAAELMMYGGSIESWAPRVLEVIGPNDVRYNMYAGAFLKQFSTHGIQK